MSTSTEVKISGKSIAAFYARWVPGAGVTCTANTFRAASVGMSGVITDNSNKSYIRMKLMNNGEYIGSGLTPPKRVSDVVALTENTITYKIFKDSDEHTATWVLTDKAGN